MKTVLTLKGCFAEGTVLRISVLLLGAVLMHAGCAAGLPKPAGFVDAARLEDVREEIPFHRGWARVSFEEHARFKNIYIAPVNIDYLFENSTWKNLERGNKVKEDARGIAHYARETFIQAYREDPNHRFKVVEEPGPETVTLELAITELVPNKVVLKVASLVPYVGTAFRLLLMANRSTVAFEARLSDAETGKELIIVTDRETEKAHIVNVKDYTWYAHAKSIIREWADQFVLMCNKGPDEMIEDSHKFELKPW